MQHLDLNFNYYYNIYDNVHQMMVDRNYISEKGKLSKEDYIAKCIKYLDLTPTEFIKKLCIIFNGKTKLLVYWAIIGQFKKKDIEYVHKLMNKKGCNSVLIISNSNVTNNVNNVFNILNDFQLLDQKELLTNIPKHRLNPDIILLSSDEKKELLDSYNVTLDKLPCIYIGDPVVKWFNAKVGDVFKFIRSDSLYYRTVVAE